MTDRMDAVVATKCNALGELLLAVVGVCLLTVSAIATALLTV